MWCLLVVILKGFHLGWLCFHCPAVCNLFSTLVCVWGHSKLLEGSWHSATHSFRLLRSSGTLPWHLWGGTLAWPREKQNKTAEPKCEVISLCWRPQRLQISLKSLLQKRVCCLSSLEAMIYSEFCKPHWDLQDATWLWDTRSLETGLRKSDLVNICLHPRNLQSCPQIWMGWSTLDSPCVSLHYSLSSQKVKMLCPPREGRQPNPSPDNTQYHTVVTKNKLV